MPKEKLDKRDTIIKQMARIDEELKSQKEIYQKAKATNKAKAVSKERVFDSLKDDMSHNDGVGY